MIEASAKLKYILIADTLLLILCVAGIVSMQQKAKLPFQLSSSGSFNSIVIPKDDPYNFSSNDKLISIDGFIIRNNDYVEYITDRKNIGKYVSINVINVSGVRTLKIKLASFYDDFYIISASLTAILFFIIALFVLIKKSESKAAHIFHWAGVGTAIIMCTTWANQNTYPPFLNYILRGIFHLAYVITPILFIHFALSFPRDKEYRWRTFIYTNYVLAGLLAILITTAFIISSVANDDISIQNYLLTFTVTRIYIAMAVITAIIIFFASYINANSRVERKKIKWLLLGFIIGPFSFIVFWVLPQEFLGTGFLPEKIIILLQLAVPLTFAIAIVKYHLLDIDQVINRSIVYVIVISILVILYSAALGIFVSASHTSDQSTISAIAAILLAILFQPIKTKVQIFVDKKFFRIQYNFREELNRFTEQIKNYNDVTSLGEYLIRKIDNLIPVEKIGFSELDNQTGRLFIRSQMNFDQLANKSIKIKPENLESKRFQAAAIKNKIETDADISTIFQNTLVRWEISLIVPIKSVNEELYGFIILGNKKSGARFSTEDVDLLKDVGINAGSTIERIKLQEQLIRGKVEIEKLEELNQHKSLFVSNVSHELKTPLTSIKIFAEMLLQNEKALSDKSKGHIEIIEGETNRLKRLINNVLDFSKIEKGVQCYSFGEIGLNKIVKDVIEMMRYTLKMKGFNLETKIGNFNDLIYADADAITEAIENIITNAIRFSTDKKEITISTYSENNFVCVSVKDNGVGIHQSDFEKIFDPFFRSENVIAKKIDGTGLGLPIVKHIMVEHKGKILIDSTIDVGTVITLCFPTLSNNDGVDNEKTFNY